MKLFDRILQNWRISKARPYFKANLRILDIGCSDGALFRELAGSFAEGVGIDPDLASSVRADSYQLLSGDFPKALGNDHPFDVITMLAVLEHIPQEVQPHFARDCARYLKPAGVLVITVPSPLVDKIITVLRWLRIMEGTRFDQHYGFDCAQTPALFGGAGLKLIKAKKFQLGLNNLFVFQKPG